MSLLSPSMTRLEPIEQKIALKMQRDEEFKRVVVAARAAAKQAAARA